MAKRAVLIVAVSLLVLDLISMCVAIAPTNPKVEFSISVSSSSSVKKTRIESFVEQTGIGLCSIWIGGDQYVDFARFNYVSNAPTSETMMSPPQKTKLYRDIDVVDGINDCRVVVMDATSWYISGDPSTSYSSINETFGAIGVSYLESSGGFKVVLREDTTILPFAIGFKDGVETRRLSGAKIMMASVLSDTDHLFIGTIAGGTGTPTGDFTTAYPNSISIAVYDQNTWAVCAITDKFGCVFSSNAVVFEEVYVPITATMAAISFVDCNNLAVVLANQGQYVLDLLDIGTKKLSGGGYYSAGGSNTYGTVSIATTNKITSILMSNTSGVFLDVFSWDFVSTCTASEPTSPTPTGTPSTTPPPTVTPQTSNTPDGSTGNTTGTPPPSNVVDGPNGDNSTKPVNPVSLGVGIAVPLVVLGVGVFLLVFLLKRRNKKRKQEHDKTTLNPVQDIDSPPPSVKPTEPGVYQNLPSNNNANNKNTYTSLGNVANDSFATASAAIELPEIDKRLHIPYKSLVFIKEIGAGSYGKVFLGEWRGAKVAIKVNNQITDVDGFLAEAKLTLGIAPHPNLVQTFGVSLDGPNPCIVLEYCGGGSLDLVLYDTNNELETAKQREYAMKIAYGLLHLHNNNIVHRDLAARNILLTNDQQPKISDFGMSRIIQEENSKGHTKTNFGPIRWMAPESLRDRSYSVKADVWSYGIVVNEIVSRKEPHVNEDQLSIAVKIRDQAVTPAIPSDGDPVLVSVIHKCLKADPKDRPTMEELCQFLRAKLD